MKLGSAPAALDSGADDTDAAGSVEGDETLGGTVADAPTLGDGTGDAVHAASSATIASEPTLRMGLIVRGVSESADPHLEDAMPFYLTRFSYAPATWAKLIKNPEDRRTAASKYIESVGGKLHGFWYAFGDHDAYSLWEAPDNVAMAATAIAISAGGALSSFQTTPLITVEETLAALEKASSISYRPPGEKP